MRRAPPTLPVNPAMLRHFAVLTVVATVCLAMFASGENASALREAQAAKRARSSGAWGTAPAAPAPAKGEREVNGMKLASGTRLNQNSNYEHEPEVYRTEQEAQGNIRNLDPQYRSLPPGSVGVPGIAAAAGTPAAAIKRDPAGVPLAPIGSGQAKVPGNAKLQPPRQANTQDIERMMEASRSRSTRGSASSEGGGGGESLYPED